MVAKLANICTVFCVFMSILTLKVVCQYFCFKSKKLKEKKRLTNKAIDSLNVLKIKNKKNKKRQILVES
jgi:hypothetical protein